MKKNHFLKKVGVVGIIVIFICASFVSNIGGYSEEINQIDTDVADVFVSQENVLVTCRTFGFPGEPSQEITMSLDEAEFLLDKIKDLQIENARDPLSEKAQQLQHEIIALADEHNLLPAGLSVETLKSRLIQSSRPQYPRIKLPRLQNRASELFCNYVSIGSGSSFPIIILPRLIPILLTPIPRLFVRWSTLDGVTSCGGLRSGTGFIAYGAQNGIALGFWGIGFSIFLPPVMAYGLLGYALFASVNAQEIELWPPNYPPEITAVSPLDGSENVPISTSELRFQISDLNGDLMSYSVTTTPDIGSGSRNNKPDGTYSVPISGLEGSEEYTWHVQVSDGENLVDSTFTFTTELVAPVVSNPSPKDGARHVHMPLTQLSFHLNDFQGDLMDYSVETYPDIGSDSATGVGDGTYTVDVSGVDYSTQYTWYVNVTDGTYWKKREFSFTTEEAPFNPFDEGWQYRKEITIDHTKVNGDLTNFPVLVSTVDSNLRDKAQDDGDDILFMEESGVSRKLFHEIEHFDGSSGELVVWVNINSLSSTADTTLWLYYGNPTCGNQENIVDVWDSNYIMVQHLSETSGTHYDSTSNNHDSSTVHVTNQNAEGKIAGADEWETSNHDYIDISDSPDWDFKSGPLTLSFWINMQSSGGSRGTFFITQRNGGTPGGFEWYHNKLKLKQAWNYNNKNGIFDVDWAPSLNTWRYLTLTRSENVHTIYEDGSSLGSVTKSGSLTNVDGAIRIGGYNLIGEYDLDGVIDEVRISNMGRSSNWVSTEYNNQNDPSSFLNFGPEETGP